MEQTSTTMDFYVLPEGCISNVLSLTTPRDACRSSLVSSVFRSAVESDIVWERFLPSDYHEIISKSDSQFPMVFSSKKELYFYLCDTHLLIDGGKKSFGLEKWSGKKCYMMGARELQIVWGDTPSYWKWRSLPESRFAEVAELVNVCWLEIHGKMNTKELSPKTNYAAYLVFKTGEGLYGFNAQPTEVSVKFTGGGGGGGEVRKVFLDPADGNESQQHHLIIPRTRTGYHRRFHRVMELAANMSRKEEGELPKKRNDGWMEIEMGEFFNNGGDEDEAVDMSLLEVNGGHWKAGLIVQGIELRPKEGK